MKRLKNFIAKLSKKTKIALGIAGALVAVAVPAAVHAGFGPNGANRVVYDFANPAQREGAFDGPHFNSYINTNVYGDERAFLDAKECVVNGPACYQNGVAGGYVDAQTVTPGKEYIIRAYIHNDANPSINDNPATAAPLDGIGVAKNTRIRFELPAGNGAANGFTAQARITADNALPQEVYDTVNLKNLTQKFGLEYVPGSAYIFNASHQGGLNLSDNIMSPTGTLLGDNLMDGNYPGCFNYSAFVVIRVKATAPQLNIQKLASKVSMPTMADTAESVTVKRGENVSWRINFSNTGTLAATNVTLRDVVPAGLSVVPGSIVLTTSNGNTTLPDTALGSGGVNMGTFTVSGNGAIRFTTTVNTPDNICSLTNTAYIRADNVAELSDTAQVVISDCNPPVALFRCDAFTSSKPNVTTGEKVTVTARFTALNGATFKQATFNFGDNNTFSTNNATNGVVTADHTYTVKGNYAIKAKLDFNVNGQTQSVESPQCAAVLGVSTTTPPTELPNTGAGDIAGIFAAVTLAGAFVHNLLVRRSVRG